jgi:hypothetical protein
MAVTEPFHGSQRRSSAELLPLIQRLQLRDRKLLLDGPVYVTKNGEADLVVMSAAAYFVGWDESRDATDTDALDDERLPLMVLGPAGAAERATPLEFLLGFGANLEGRSVTKAVTS